MRRPKGSNTLLSKEITITQTKAFIIDMLKQKHNNSTIKALVTEVNAYSNPDAYINFLRDDLNKLQKDTE